MGTFTRNNGGLKNMSNNVLELTIRLKFKTLLNTSIFINVWKLKLNLKNGIIKTVIFITIFSQIQFSLSSKKKFSKNRIFF